MEIKMDKKEIQKIFTNPEQRINFLLNKAIKKGNAKRITRIQKLFIQYYNIPFSDWVVSQFNSDKERKEYFKAKG